MPSSLSSSSAPRPLALVTGSGRGIGRGIALRLAHDGYDLLLNSVSADPARTDEGAYEVKAVIERAGGRADVIRADVGDPAGRAAILDRVDAAGRLDLLVNNAGIAPRLRADILEASEESFDELMRVNLKGPYFLTQQLARRMLAWRAEGLVAVPRICFVTSISAYTVSPSRGEYCVSKAGLAMGAALFAARLAGEGIPVIEVRPGIIATRMTAAVKDKYDALIADGLIPQRRWGTPEDVAGVVAAFARGDLDYCAGTAIEAGGGFHLHRL